MTARELCQSRSTDRDGNTVWTLSPVITAALKGMPESPSLPYLLGHLRLSSQATLLLLAGQMLILDGVHRLRNDVLHVLHPLIHDRTLHLSDGSLLLPGPAFDGES